MIFYKKITICNIFAYYGKQSIEFSPNSQKPLYLIYGRNGFGKTSFIRSLKLLFLGSGLLDGSGVPENLSKFKEKGPGKFTSNTFLLGSANENKWRGVFNDKALKENENNFFVELVLQKDEKEIIVKRSWTRFPQPNEKLEVKFDDRVFENNEAKEQLEQILPSEFIEFFIFDGEEIEELAENIGSELKSKIQNILNISVLEILTKQTDIAERDLYTKNAKNSQDKAMLIEFEANLKKDELLLKSTEDNMAYLSSRKKELENDLEIKENKRELDIEKNAKEVGKLQQEKKNLELNLQKYKDEIKEFGGDFLFLGLDDFMKELLSDLQDNSDASNLDIQKLSKLCEYSVDYLYAQCDIADTKTAFAIKLNKAFEKFIQENSTNKIYKNINGLTSLNAIYNGVQTSLNLLSKNILNIKEAGANLESYEALISSADLDTEIKNELERAKKEIEDLKRQIFECEENIKSGKNKFENLQADINNSEMQIKNLKEQMGQDNRIKRQLAIIKELKEIIKQYKEKRIERVTKQLKDKIFENYKRLLPNDNVMGVEIENFAVYLKNSDGENIAIANQSAGQKQIVAISIFWALSELSDRKLPLVIDTPLARMDMKNRESIIENYYFNASNQVIVLPHSGEFGEKEYSVAKNKVAELYKIKNDNTREHASIDKSTIDEILGE